MGASSKSVGKMRRPELSIKRPQFRKDSLLATKWSADVSGIERRASLAWLQRLPVKATAVVAAFL